MFKELPSKSAEFLQAWARIKEEKTGKKTRIKRLGEKEEKHLKKLLQSGYGLKEFEEAATALFNDPGKYAVEHGLDIPLHLFRNFERYLELSETLKAKEKPKKTAEETKEAKGDFLPANEWEKACWNEYRKSLTAGKWLGSFAHSIPISGKLAEFINPKRKKELWEEAKAEREAMKARKDEFKTAMQIAEFDIKTAVNIYGEKITVEAIEQKIDVWKAG